MRRLMAYSWPGNVRQLENVVERALAFSQGRPQIDAAGPRAGDPASRRRPLVRGPWLPDEGLDFERVHRRLELALIRRSLERTQGNKRQAAKLLNLKRTTLIEKLKRLEPRADDRTLRSSPERPEHSMPPRHVYWTIILEGSRRPSARTRAKSCCRRSSSCRPDTRTSR